MADVLMISKPVAPPWNDSSKNLVRDLAEGMRRYRPVVMGKVGGGFDLERGRVERVYGHTSGNYAPGLLENLKPLRRLIVGRRADLWHFFFAPNPKTSTVARVACTTRRMRSVQTVCSAPAENVNLKRVLFADKVVVLSRHTEQRLVAGGISSSRVRRIPPCVAGLSPRRHAEWGTLRRELGLPEDRTLILFPGDLEFGGGAQIVVDALAHVQAAGPFGEKVDLVMACRPKTASALQEEMRLKEQLSKRGLASRVHWVGETPRIHDVLACADVVCLPSTNLYAKMDYPLVLIEAMSLMRPVVVAKGTPCQELCEGEAAVAVDPTPDALAREVVALITDSERRQLLGDRARKRVAEQFEPGRMAQRYEALYDELLSS